MDLWQDLRYGARRLLEARWFTLAAVLALGLGIGANAAVFTFVSAVLLQSLLLQTSPGDPVTLGAVAVVMALVAILVCLWPTRRAARLDPVTALRVD